MRALPTVKVEGKTYFLDERLMELRNVVNPHDRVPLKDYHLYYFRVTGKLVLD